MILVPAAKSAGTEQLKQRFLREAPARWDEYQKWADRLQGDIALTVHHDGKLVEHDRWSFKSNHDCLLTHQQPMGGGAEQLWAVNPSYAFQLVRNTGNTGWARSGLALTQDQAEARELAYPVRRACAFRHMLVRVQAVDLAAVVAHPNFRLLNAEPIEHKGARFVRVTFDCTHAINVKEDASKFVPVQSGEVLLDPDHFWCIRSCDVRCKYSNSESRLQADMKMVVPVGRYPMPKREEGTDDFVLTNGKHLHQVLVREFDLHEPPSLPADSEFTLSAYGLPEPMARSLVSRVPWFVWIAAAGILCLIGSILLARLQRRKTNMMPK